MPDTLTASQPTQSEIVSITGALIVASFLTACVLLTHLFNALHDLRQKISFIDLVRRTRNVNVSIGNILLITTTIVMREFTAMMSYLKCAIVTWLCRSQKRTFLWFQRWQISSIKLKEIQFESEIDSMRLILLNYFLTAIILSFFKRLGTLSYDLTYRRQTFLACIIFSAKTSFPTFHIEVNNTTVPRTPSQKSHHGRAPF